jgi:hypothetical protein
MLTFGVVACLLCLGLGFAAGRVKNAAKLAGVKADLQDVENRSEAGIKALLLKVKAKL